MRPLSTASEQEIEVDDESLDEVILVEPAARPWVRILLVAIALGLALVFGIAIYLNPYRTNGEARTWETHRQLGLPECGFKTYTGLPCPSCGMTTSFSLLIRGDVINSLQANFVGTMLAAVCLLYIPWGFASAWKGRPLGIKSIEDWLCRFIVVLVTLMLIRWGIVIAVMLASRGS